MLPEKQGQTVSQSMKRLTNKKQQTNRKNIPQNKQIHRQKDGQTE